MKVEITYTNAMGDTRTVSASTPDEAMTALSSLPGFGMQPIDEILRELRRHGGEG